MIFIILRNTVGQIASFLVLAALASLSLMSCSEQNDAPVPQAGVPAVSMPDPYSAKVAADILSQGGNAVDAAVAAGFVLAVTHPESGNIGGGGFMTLAVPGASGSDVHFLDYREKAPAAAHRDMYLGADGNVVEGLSFTGPLSVGVPGTVAGLYESHRRFGSLPWSDLVQPSVRLAREGFLPDEKMVAMLRESEARLISVANFSTYFSHMEQGVLFKQPELAATLQRIAEHGSDGFYKGETADHLIATMETYGGLITHDDLDAYEVRWRQPLTFEWQGYDVVTAPLPSSGGIALAQLFGMKSELDEAFKEAPLGSDHYVHLIAEIEKRVFADRAQHLGDPDFVTAPLASLMDAEYLAQRAGEVNRDEISLEGDVRPGLQESKETTHFSIVDGMGGAVSNTYTLNWEYGSGVVVEGAGFLLNDEMDDFSAKPGIENAYGVIGDEANAIAPGKRMLSSMSPTLLMKDGRPRIVIGTPGGSTIFTSVFQVLLNSEIHRLGVSEAVNRRRFHHQLPGGQIVYFEGTRPLEPSLVEALETRGYQVEKLWNTIGDVQMIKVHEDGTVEAASDSRGRGMALVGPYKD